MQNFAVKAHHKAIDALVRSTVLSRLHSGEQLLIVGFIPLRKQLLIENTVNSKR